MTFTACRRIARQRKIIGQLQFFKNIAAHDLIAIIILRGSIFFESKNLRCKVEIHLVIFARDHAAPLRSEQHLSVAAHATESKVIGLVIPRELRYR